MLCLLVALGTSPALAVDETEENEATELTEEVPDEEADDSEQDGPDGDDVPVGDDAGDAPEGETEEPAVEEPKRIQLVPLEDLDTALDDFDAAVEETDDLPPELLEALDEAGRMNALRNAASKLLRGKFFFRPMLSVSGLRESGRTWTAPRIGLMLGHRWWPLGDSALKLAGESQLAFSAPFGGASGRTLELNSVLGPWIGPVGIKVGPAARYDRTEWGDTPLILDTSLAVGPRAIVSFDIPYVHPYIGVEPMWLVLGDREGADWESLTVPGFLDETTWLGGLRIDSGWLQYLIQARWRGTSAGAVLDVGLGIHIQPKL